MSADLRTVQHPPRLQAGKAATKALIRAFGGQEAASAETGKSQPRLAAYGLPNTPDFAPIDVIAALEGETHGLPGHPHVTRWLAREAGFLLVKAPTALADDADWCSALGDCVAEFNDVQTRLLAALPGGVSANEIREADIVGQIDEAMETLARLRALAVLAAEAA